MTKQRLIPESKRCNYNNHFKADDCNKEGVWKRATVMGQERLCAVHALIDIALSLKNAK